MRKLLALAVAGLAAAVSTAFAATSPGGHAVVVRTRMQAALERTTEASSVRYAIRVKMTHAGMPYTLRIDGQSSSRSLTMQMRLGDLHLSDGSVLPGADAAAVLAGPYLYERAPSSVVVFGKIHWLRVHVAPDRAHDLQTVRELTAAPILRVLDAARLTATSPHTFRGTIAYDAPALGANLAKLTGGIQFRDWQIAGTLGATGLVRSVTLRGRTADAKTTFVLHAQLSGFGSRVHVHLPKPGTFMDAQLASQTA
jgi:hypothetical protein